MANVFGFGAVGDGVTDDTDALQHTLDSGDGILRLNKGTYRITKPLLPFAVRIARMKTTIPWPTHLVDQLSWNRPSHIHQVPLLCRKCSGRVSSPHLPMNPKLTP